MINSTIGIKIADGSFYPIVERDSGRWKRVILTTVKDEQTNVQIDLYEGEGEDIESAKYVGSLLIEDITPLPAGESEIELRIGVEEGGKLSARAEDLGSGESQSLNVSLESLTEENIYDIPEFELGNDLDAWSDLDDFSGGEDEVETIGTYDEDQYTDPDPSYVPPPKRKPLLLALFILFGIAAVAALTIFLYKVFEGPSVPPLEARRQTAVEIAADNQGEEESPADTNGADTTPNTAAATAPESTGTGKSGTRESVRDGPLRTETAGATPSAPDTLIGGVWYWIRWGDTLWDISSSFYRTPWHYGRIANENSIRNPDLIFAGSKIFIPEKE